MEVTGGEFASGAAIAFGPAGVAAGHARYITVDDFVGWGTRIRT